MGKPIRVQRRRVKGWRMPPNTVSVTRPGKFGNPFTVGCDPSEYSTALPHRCETIEDAILCFDYYARSWVALTGGRWCEPLRGKNLACYCALDKPCHADVLLRLSNA